MTPRRSARLGYVILYVPHVPRTIAFFEKAFGLPTVYFNEEEVYAEMDTGDVRLGIAREDFIREQGVEFQAISRHRMPQAFGLAFTTPNVKATLHKAVQAGAEPLKAPAEKPWGQTVAYVRSPDGHVIEICTPMPPRTEEDS